jgi:hypothetical protein
MAKVYFSPKKIRLIYIEKYFFRMLKFLYSNFTIVSPILTSILSSISFLSVSSLMLNYLDK